MHVFRCRLEYSGLSAALHQISLPPMSSTIPLFPRASYPYCVGARFPRPQAKSTNQRNVASILLYQNIANDFKWCASSAPKRLCSIWILGPGVVDTCSTQTLRCILAWNSMTVQIAWICLEFTWNLPCSSNRCPIHSVNKLKLRRQKVKISWNCLKLKHRMSLSNRPVPEICLRDIRPAVNNDPHALRSPCCKINLFWLETNL